MPRDNGHGQNVYYIKYLLKLDGFCFILLLMVKFTDTTMPKNKRKADTYFKRNCNLYGTLKVTPLCIEKFTLASIGQHCTLQ